ncbi:hypothetical protein [Planotetraspora sp. GP83]|uniref:hypothetical protein n=1 Tax=Planotetraspora sp. GP83 TaxID=3156264 RepID=UPI0035190AA9
MARKIATTIGAVAVGALALAAASAPAYADVASGHGQEQKNLLISTNTQQVVPGNSDSSSRALTGDRQTRDGHGDHDWDHGNNHHNDGDHHSDNDSDDNSDHAGNHHGNHDDHQWNHHGNHDDHQWNHHGNWWNDNDWNYGNHYWNYDHSWNQWGHKGGLHIKWHHSRNDSRETRITGFYVTPERVHKGDRISLGGRLRSRATDGYHVGRQRISVYFHSSGSGDWRNVGTIATDSGGSFRANVRAYRSGTWRVKFNGNNRLGYSEAHDYVKVVD